MTNEQIITNVALASGTYTESEIESFIESGMEIPLHTFKGWSDRGYKIKKGATGIETRLWKKKKETKKETTDDTDSSSEISSNSFYLCKSFLFSFDQVEPLTRK